MLTRLAIAICVVPAAAAFAQELPYEKYKLDNGLTVILHEDHKLPVAAVNLWFRVGAQNEPKGRSGFAHLFEHLMFMGTERVPGSDFDNIMEVGGGSNNASTSLDRTNYFSFGPSALLPTLLWLEADRLEDLGRTMTTEKLKLQQDVVRNEIRQNVENAPYGRMEEYVNRYMFPEGHPYHWNVYGLHEDLEAADVHNVKDFFATFYVPRNCSLVVAGDFESAKVKPLIESLFASLAPGAVPAQPTTAQFPQPRIDRATTVTMLDKVELPRIRYAYHSPPHFANGDAELDLAAAVLTSGKSSRLYRRLVLDEKLAVDVSAAQDSAVLGSQFFIDITCAPEADLERVQAAADEEIARLAAAGPTDAELEPHKATIELAQLAQVESVEAVADVLNKYEYAFGEPNSLKRDLDRYRNATPNAVKDWAGRVLRPDGRVIMRCLPEGSGDGRAPSARDTRPQDAVPGKFTVPAPETFTLANGLPVMYWQRTGVPLVTMELMIPDAATAAPVEKAGLALLTAQMLGEGAAERDALQFSDAVRALGATLSCGSGRENFAVSLTVLKRNLGQAAALMSDAIRRPRLTETDFERVKRLHLEDLQQVLADPRGFSANVVAKLVFGADHPYGVPVEGTLESVEKLTLGDVKALYASVFGARPARATLLISGDLNRDEAAAAAERALGDWPARAPTDTAELIPASASGGTAGSFRCFVIDRPDAVQTVVRVAAPAAGASDPSRVRLSVMNVLFGGSFTSRLNRNLREVHGYTYGARSRFDQFIGGGVFTVSTSVKAEVTGAAVGEVAKELQRLRGGPIGATFVAAPRGDISDAEVVKAVQTARTEIIGEFQSHAGPLGVAARCLASGRPYESVARDLMELDTVTADQLNLESRAATRLEEGFILLIGDKKLIMEQIKGLELPKPVELDPEGNVVRME